jgi:hypothetical protein
MPYLTNYHLSPQEAYALLGPVRDELRRLTARTAHYASRLALEPAQLEAVQDAQRVLAAASQEVERIWLQSDPARRAGSSPRLPPASPLRPPAPARDAEAGGPGGQE